MNPWFEVGPWFEAGLSNALVATLLALIASLVPRVCRRPEAAFAVWLLVLAKLLMPPLVSLPWPSPNVFSLTPLLLSGSVEAPGVEISQSAFARPGLLTTVFAIWALGSMAWFVVALARIWRFGRTLRRADLADDDLQMEVVDLARRLGLRHLPLVRTIDRQVPPLAWAMTGRPTILLPKELLRGLTAPERATLLAHELAHLKRGDHYLCWLELVTLGLYWWHPVAWWARRNLHQAVEQCCDARVVTLLPELARDYARALMATVDFLAESQPALPLGASGFYQFHELKRRMEMILSGSVARRANWRSRWAMLAIALIVLPISLRTLKAADDKPKADESSWSVEQRLERLEAMIRRLAEKVEGRDVRDGNSENERRESARRRTSAERGAAESPSSTGLEEARRKLARARAEAERRGVASDAKRREEEALRAQARALEAEVRRFDEAGRRDLQKRKERSESQREEK